jgi:TolB protein
MRRRLPGPLVLAAGATVAVCVALGGSAARATFPGAVNGKIAFASDRDGDVEVYVMNPDGSDQTRLTSNPGADTYPGWSADGTRIVFHSNRDGNQEIYAMNADGSGQTRLTSDPSDDTFPAWSPDGRRIVFTSARDRANGVGSQIYVMNADGSGQTRLATPDVLDWQPSWSPDGSRIAFASTDTQSDISVINPDGSGLTKVSNDPDIDLFPNWSPDGRRIAYSTTNSQNSSSQIAVINADGTGRAVLTSGSGFDSGPVWSPDGTKIAYSSTRDGPTDIYVMNADGSGQTRVTSGPGNNGSSSWSANVAPAPPKLGETVNVSVVSGTVLVRTRGASGFSTLAQARQIKVGSQLDTKKGVVRLASAADNKGHTQSGDFGRGVFQVTQSKAAKGLTDLKLMGGSFGSCKATAKKGSVSKAKTLRSLFSKAKGRFRTKGRYSAASVRGTSWLVADRCDGTLTTVKSGTVSVFDFKRKKTVKVKAGKSYLARAR